MVSSVVSGTTGTVVLAIQDASSLNHVFVGDSIAFKSDPATASLQTGSMTITVVDVAQKRLTGTMAGGGNATSYAGYSFGLASTFADSTARQTMHGFKSMFTRTGLTSSFEGLSSRASDPVRLAGHYLDAGTMSAKDCISTLISSISNFASAKPEYAIVSPATLLEIEQDVGAKIRYSTTSGTGAGKGASIDFGTQSYQGPKGVVNVVSSPAMPDTDIVVIDPTSLVVGYAGDEMIGNMDEGENGSGWVQLQGADAKQLGIRTISFFACEAFWKNGRAVRSL